MSIIQFWQLLTNFSEDNLDFHFRFVKKQIKYKKKYLYINEPLASYVEEKVVRMGIYSKRQKKVIFKV